MSQPDELPLSPEEIRRIRRLVNFRLGPEYDRELIADDIILDALTNDIKHTPKGYIFKKCATAYQERKRELEVNKKSLEFHQAESLSVKSDKEIQALKDVVDKLTKVLDQDEQRVIWMKYWMDLTLEEICKEMKMRRERVQSIIRIALFKMNQEGVR